MYRSALAALSFTLLGGCLLPPEIDTPPLAKSEVTSATTSGPCSGTYSGDVPNGSHGADDYAGQCTITGSVNVDDTTDAATLALLKKVKVINGDVSVGGKLEFGAQFPNLTKVNTILITSQAASINGPAALTSANHIAINSTGAVTVKGFDGVTKLSALEMSGNSQLTSITGFSKLQSVANLDLLTMPLLTALPTFPSLTAVQNVVHVDNLGVAHLSLSALDSSSMLHVAHCKALTTLETPKLHTLGNLRIEDCPALLSLDGLGPVQVSSSVYVCHIAEPGADRQKWLEIHAPGKQFPNCGDGCFGWGTCQ